MANTLTALMDVILSRVLIHQRKRVILPQLVNRDLQLKPGRKGKTIDVVVPTKLAPYDITPGATRGAGNDDTAVTTVPVTLDKWKGNGFRLTDQDIAEIDATSDFLPMETTEAANGLVDLMNQDIADSYKSIFGFVGTAGQTPFQRVDPPTLPHHDADILADANGAMNDQTAPNDPRYAVWSIPAHTNALKLDAFRHAEKLGDSRIGQRAQLGMLGGFENFWQHYLATHTAGTQTGDPTVTGANAVGAKVVNLTCDADDDIAYVEGDIIQFSGDSQTYVVKDSAGVTIGNSATGNVTIEPGLVVATTGGETVSVKATHVVNLAFNPFAFAFAMRTPEEMRIPGLPEENVRTLQDPLTGIVMRLELLREHKQWYFELDALWGAACPIPHLAVRCAG